MSRITRRALLGGAAGLGALSLSGRPAGVAWLRPATAAAASVPIVAAENFYGDVVGQIAGDRAALTSILNDPNVDPHAYEANAQNAAAVARARLVIVNGLGYDAFMTRLLRASPNPARRVIVVGTLVGRKDGDNPHVWYDPPTMLKVARTVADTLTTVDPGGAQSYRHRLTAFETSYGSLTGKVAALRARFAEMPIAATEPVFNYMAAALGLKVITPETFQKAIEDGNEPPAAAMAQMQDHLRIGQAKVLVYNTQTVTPVTERVKKDAQRAGLPIVGVSETEPPRTTYQRWMLAQLDALEHALAGARP